MGHFSNLSDALKYAKRFSQIYTKAGTPEIHLKSGKHTIKYDITTDSTLAVWRSNTEAAGSNSDKTLFYDSIIDMGLAIDFPISISGEGDGTDLEIILNLTTSDETNYEEAGLLAVLGLGFNTTGTETSKIHDRFSSGVVSFKNFKISTGAIGLIDLNNMEDSTPLNFCINISGINLESNYIRLIEASDSSNYKGNVVISNNKLYGAISETPDSSAVRARLKNISILNNIFPTGEGMTSLIGGNFLYSAESNIVYLGNISGIPMGMGIGRKDRVAYDLFVPNDLDVAGNIDIAGDLTVDTITSSAIISDTITSDSYVISNLNNLAKIVPMTDFYSIMQLTSSETYTHDDVLWAQRLGSLGLQIPGMVIFSSVGSYIWIVLDSYLINNATLESIKLVVSSAGGQTITLSLYDSDSIDNNTSPIFVDDYSNNITSITTREELTFNFNYLYSTDKICYLKLEYTSGSGGIGLYRLALSINTNDSISTSLNVI
jgi:hypothetical protein